VGPPSLIADQGFSGRFLVHMYFLSSLIREDFNSTIRTLKSAGLADENPENSARVRPIGPVMEPSNLPDPLRPRPIGPMPSPLRPGQYIGPREEELGRILKEILDKITLIENRLKAIEEQIKARK